TARRMIRKVLESDPAGRVLLLVRGKFRADLDEFLGAPEMVKAGSRERVTVYEGDVCDMDLGLAGGEYKAIAEEVTSIFDLAQIYFLGVKRDVMERVNVEGTRSILEFAEDCPSLRRLSYFSTAQV